jgi:hypothetical protein
MHRGAGAGLIDSRWSVHLQGPLFHRPSQLPPPGAAIRLPGVLIRGFQFGRLQAPFFGIPSPVDDSGSQTETNCLDGWMDR